MKKIIVRIFPLIIFTAALSASFACDDKNKQNHANEPRSEPGEGYKTPGPSAGGEPDTNVINRHDKCK